LEDIVFVGYVSEADKPRYYKTADVYCSPATSRESFGIVLLEAMAVGTPVIASNIDGYSTVVTHGEDGLLVPPRDTGSLAQTIISVLCDETLRQKLIAGGRLTAEKYSWEKVARGIVDYYTEVIGQSSGKNIP